MSIKSVFSTKDQFRISNEAPFHAGTFGFFEFIGGKNNDIIVLRKHWNEDIQPKELIAVGIENAFLVGVTK